MVLVQATCVSTDRSRFGEAGRTLVVGYRSTITSLDPIRENTVISNSIFCNIYEPLVTRDVDMKIRPLLAADWVNPDERTWMLKLRPDVRFHDGSPLRAADVQFSLQRARDSQSSRLAGSLTMLERVDIVNDQTVRIVTKKPYAMLLGRLVDIWILSKKSIEESTSDILPGTGPYLVRDWKSGEYVDLGAFEGYWRGKPPIERVRFEAVPDVMARVEGLKRGRISILPILEPAALFQIRRPAAASLRIGSSPGLLVLYLGMDVARDHSPHLDQRANPFRDPRVRRAIYQAIDIRRIVEDVLQRNAVESTQIVAPGVTGFCPDIRRLPYDPARSRDMLAAAGYPNGFVVRLDITNNRYRSDIEVGRAVAADLMKIGVRVTLNPVSVDTLNRLKQSLDTSFFMSGWSLPSADASGVFDFCVHSPDPQRGYGAENAGGYADPEVDRLIELSAETMDPKSRVDLLEKAMHRVMDDVPYIPLHVENNLSASQEGVEWEQRADEFIFARTARFRQPAGDAQ